MGPTERVEEAQIEMVCHHPETSTYKLARLAIVNAEMSEIQVQLRGLTAQHEALWSEKYQLECDIARTQG